MMLKAFIYPTDTIWSLGANIEDRPSIKAVNNVKRASENKPQSIMFKDIIQLSEFIDFKKYIKEESLLKILPYGVSLLFPKNELKVKISPEIIHDSEFVSVRVNTRKIDFFDKSNLWPLTTTSVNYSGLEPINSKTKALEFIEQNKNKCLIQLISANDQIKASLDSSCMIQFQISKEDPVKIVRRNSNTDKILSVKFR